MQSSMRREGGSSYQRPSRFCLRLPARTHPASPGSPCRLCHAHIHLDKCFLLDQCDELVTGCVLVHLSEPPVLHTHAAAITAICPRLSGSLRQAKSGFPANFDDLYDRSGKVNKSWIHFARLVPIGSGR